MGILFCRADPAGRLAEPSHLDNQAVDPAEMVVQSRLAELLIHHVDLAIAFAPGYWPAVFVREMLDVTVAALNDRSLAPLTARLEAADMGRGSRSAARRRHSDLRD
jgi:hypothetical protein